MRIAIALLGLSSGCIIYTAPRPSPDAARVPDGPQLAISDAPAVCKYGDVARCASQCASSDYESCNNFGAMFETGRGVPRDVMTARTYYELACAARVEPACGNLARLATPPPAAPSAPAPTAAPAPAAPPPANEVRPAVRLTVDVYPNGDARVVR